MTAKEQLTYTINGLAMECHRELGPGLDEEFYHVLLSEKILAAGIDHLVKPREVLIHRGHIADILEADIIVPGQVVAELKLLWGPFAPKHYAQIYCYLKFWRIDTGLLFDFAKESLVHKRVQFVAPPFPAIDLLPVQTEMPSFVTDRDLAHCVLESAIRVGRAHGLGYRDKTYSGLLAADLSAESVDHNVGPTVAIRCGPGFRQTELKCTVIENRCAVAVLAFRDEITAADRARLQTCLRHLELPWGLVLNYGKNTLEWRWVCRPNVAGEKRDSHPIPS